MAGEILKPNEAPNVIPEFQLNLSDVPSDSPEKFNDVLAKNIEAARDGLIDYLKANRQKAIEQNPMAEFFKEDYNAVLSAQIDLFVANIRNSANVMLSVLRQNRDKPIEEQKTALAMVGHEFHLKLGEQQGVMQSYIPFKLKAGYETIEQRVFAPLNQSYAKAQPTYMPPVKREYIDDDAVRADQILEASLNSQKNS